MRRLPARKKLTRAITNRLLSDTGLIESAADQKAEAIRLYSNARVSVWFKPVTNALRKLSGNGERCMFCSGSESSEVDHFRPKALFPKLAMTWENYLWTCGLCNLTKSDDFPLDGAGNAMLINPLEEDVWVYFYIDQFGNVTPKWDVVAKGFNARGKKSAEILGMDRQALQESRRSRMRQLRERVNDTLMLIRSRKLTLEAGRKRIECWRKEPAQPDVADYFLSGPGMKTAPFKTLFGVLGISIPT